MQTVSPFAPGWHERGAGMRASLAGLERLGALQVVLGRVDYQMPAVGLALQLAPCKGQADLPVADAKLPVDADERGDKLPIRPDEEAGGCPHPLAGAVQNLAVLDAA